MLVCQLAGAGSLPPALLLTASPGIKRHRHLSRSAPLPYLSCFKVKLLSVIVPLALMGAGTGQISDYANGRSLAQDEEALKAARYSPEAAAKIAAAAKAGDWAAAEQLMRADWKAVNGKGATISEVAAKAMNEARQNLITSLEQQRLLAARELEAAGIAITRGQEGWEVLTTDGTKVSYPTHERALAAAAAHVQSRARQQAATAEGTRLSFSQSPTDGDAEVLSVHKRLSANEDSFQLGKTKPETTSMEELAVAYSRPDKALEILDVTPYQGGQSFRIATINGEAKIIVFDKSKQVLVDTSMADSNASKSGGGAQIYQLAETFALNNGFTFRADDRVSEVAQKRRISHMANSALRHGTTEHLDGLYLYYDPVTKSKKVDVPDWKPGEHDHNLALLLRREHEYVMEEATARGIDISHLTHDTATDNIINGQTGRPITNGDLKSLVAQFESGDSGVGATTLLRAIVTGSAIQGLRSDRAFDIYFKTREDTPEGLELGYLMNSWCRWHEVYTIADHRKALEEFRRGEWRTPYPNGPVGSPPPLPRRPGF